MTVKGEWSTFFKLLAFIGVLPMTRKLERTYLFSFAIINILTVFLLFFIIKYYWKEPILGFGSTGQSYEFAAEMLCTFNNLMNGIWMFFTRRDSVKIVNHVLKSEKIFQINSKCSNVKILLICTAIFLGNSVFIRFIYSNQTVSSIIIITYEIDFIRTFTFLTFYGSLIRSIQLILKCINCRLVELSKGNPSIRCCGKLLNLLELRRKLILHCRSDLSYTFGFPILFVSMIIFIELTQCPFYLMAAFDKMEVFTFKELL